MQPVLINFSVTGTLSGQARLRRGMKLSQLATGQGWEQPCLFAPTGKGPIGKLDVYAARETGQVMCAP